MRFLVTRPRPDCRRTADRLRAAGHVADEAPLLEMRVTAPDRFDLDGVAALAVTSRRTLHVLEAHVQFGNLRQLPVFTVGDATADACRKAGFADVLSATGDVGRLADLILARRAAEKPGVILYPAAEDRAGDLEGRLAAGGVSCRTVVVYRMEPAAALAPEVVSALREGAYDGVLIYSKRTAEAFVSLAGAAGLDHISTRLRFYVLSQQVAGPLGGAEDVQVAAQPNENTLLELVLTRC
ncbi:MAG: uroporphyrinogen-III synthase [Roseibium sp.]